MRSLDRSLQHSLDDCIDQSIEQSVKCSIARSIEHSIDMPFNRHGKELKQDPPVQEMPVQSMITSPSAGDIICAAKTGAKTIKVKGIAWGGGGQAPHTHPHAHAHARTHTCTQGINRVDVSLNNVKDWCKADVLDKPISQRRKSQWSWSFFEQATLATASPTLAIV